LSNQKKKERERLCECCEALFQTTTKKQNKEIIQKMKKDVSLVTNKEKKPPQARMFGALTCLACSNKALKTKQENDQNKKRRDKGR
jgi:hypothetical protein